MGPNYLLSHLEWRCHGLQDFWQNNLKLWLDWLCLYISHDSSKQPIKANNDDLSKWKHFPIRAAHPWGKKTRGTRISCSSFNLILWAVAFFIQPQEASGQTLSCFYITAWSGMGLLKPKPSHGIEICSNAGCPDSPTQLETNGSIERKKKSKRIHISIMAWLNASNKQHD